MLQQIDSLKITQAERIIDKYVDKTAEGLNTIVDKVTPMAEQGFEMAVKLQYAEGYARLTIAFIMLILIGVCWRLFRYVQKSDWNEDEEGISAIIILWAAKIGFLIGSLVHIYRGIMRIVAPEWFAFEEIIKLIN